MVPATYWQGHSQEGGWGAAAVGAPQTLGRLHRKNVTRAPQTPAGGSARPRWGVPPPDPLLNGPRLSTAKQQDRSPPSQAQRGETRPVA